ncbi:MAG TPA: hypothetical protein ENK95_03985 [Campylobacterales bacterium]|nr:hypothetical protein [Campylobacterales bacterium]
MSYTKLLSLITATTFLFASDSSIYGWNIPETPMYIGGYVETLYDETEEESFLIDDIALLVTANGESFDFLGELEISHLSLNEETNRKITQLNLERLQLTYALGEEEITLGRFNSEIGYWNQTPISIVQETTTYPHIIKHLFPKATTGLMLRSDLEPQSSYRLMMQYNQDIGKVDQSIVSDRHFAMSYYQDYDNFSWTVATGLYKDTKGLYANYAGVGFQHESDNFMLQGELFSQKSRGDKSKPYSAYLQPVWFYDEQQSVVLRLERYKDEEFGADEGIVLLGYSYRPWSNVALKAEYIYHTQEPLDRFVYSFSVIF